MPDDLDAPRRSLTVRLSVPQWHRLRQFALDADETVQNVLVAGINRLFTEHGLEPLDPDSPLLPPKKRR